jgi:hypothetical protein
MQKYNYFLEIQICIKIIITVMIFNIVEGTKIGIFVDLLAR